MHRASPCLPMTETRRPRSARLCRSVRAACAGAALLACAWTGATAQAQAPEPAQPPAQRLRIVGGLAGVNQYLLHEQPFWMRTLGQRSKQRFSAEIVPFDRAGVPAQDMVRLIQIGVVPFGTIPISRVAPQDAEFSAADLAGLNPDFATLRKTVAAFRPYLENTLRQRYGIELLAIYVYPAQMVFCKQPIVQLADLAQQRVRVSGTTGADFVAAFGATPVVTAMSDMLAQLRKGHVSCAVTGSMTGNTLGLHEVATHLYTMPITWGVSLFAANQDSWNALEPELRVLLRDELPRLEARIWEAAERETREGVACNTGAADCTSGRKGRMVAVQMNDQDGAQLRQVLQTRILPSWLQRCGPDCAKVWNQTIGPVHGIAVPGNR